MFKPAPFIVAHTYQRATFVARELGLYIAQNWNYLGPSGWHRIRGYRNPKVYVVEDFSTIPGWEELRRDLMLTDPNIIIFKEPRNGR